MLPSVTIYTNKNDVKFALYDVFEVISEQIKTNGCWNEAGLDICDKVIASLPEGSRIIDVGAGLGSFTIPLAIKYANHHIFSTFEPMHSLFLQLCTNTLLNNLSNVKNYNIGLANFTELVDAPILEIDRCANHGSYSFVKDINKLRNMPPASVNDVFEFRTLDSYRFAQVGLIKVSAPGMELEVLNGATETIIQNGFPPVLFEAWSVDWYKYQKEALLAFFQKLGYEHYCFMGEHIMAFKTFDQYNQIVNGTSAVTSTDTTETRVDNTNFVVKEQHHEINSVIENQVILR